MEICANSKKDNKISINEYDISFTNNSLWEHFNSKVSQVQITSNINVTSTLIIHQYLEMPLLDCKKILWNSRNNINTRFHNFTK